MDPSILIFDTPEAPADAGGDRILDLLGQAEGQGTGVDRILRRQHPAADVPDHGETALRLARNPDLSGWTSAVFHQTMRSVTSA
jgi:hypothetical protein